MVVTYMSAVQGISFVHVRRPASDETPPVGFWCETWRMGSIFSLLCILCSGSGQMLAVPVMLGLASKEFDDSAMDN